jgi:DNA-directed RNA polymerase beta subunit
MIPLLEHDDPFHLLMGTNMMRQWLPPSNPEPALVQTGNEPHRPDFWCGRNLLTAFVCWGEASFEEGLILSQSGAERLGDPDPVEPGDKLSNRHGIKGVVSQILPDDQMPHLADGTPVELIFHSSGLHARMNFGQLREALLGCVARSKGLPVIIPPFQAPGEDALRQRLIKNGLKWIGKAKG